MYICPCLCVFNALVLICSCVFSWMLWALGWTPNITLKQMANLSRHSKQHHQNSFNFHLFFVLFPPLLSLSFWLSFNVTQWQKRVYQRQLVLITDVLLWNSRVRQVSAHINEHHQAPTLPLLSTFMIFMLLLFTTSSFLVWRIFFLVKMSLSIQFWQSCSYLFILNHIPSKAAGVSAPLHCIDFLM